MYTHKYIHINIGMFMREREKKEKERKLNTSKVFTCSFSGALLYCENLIQII
jgi:hypothetical protein